MQNEDLKIKEFLNDNNYDIRISGDARWIDQKCTLDVVSLISDCILSYVEEYNIDSFTVKDIWESDYAANVTETVFGKPNVLDKKVSNEYDKFFGQPIKLLSYSKVLKCIGKSGAAFEYSVNKKEILKYIATRERNALNFLQLYIEKVLMDSNLFHEFEIFFEKQNQESYDTLKHAFSRYTIKYTNINGEVECGRIFTKILNPLALKYKKCGTERGRISKHIITYDDILYNKPNWRDILTNKPKNLSRVDYLNAEKYEQQVSGLQKYQIAKAKNILRDYNQTFRNGLSEVEDIEYKMGKKATQMHHIFPVSYFPELGASVENLIALTPNQHFTKAHPNNKTKEINKEYQKELMVEKILRIQESFKNEFSIYSFDELINVLNTGFETAIFSSVEYGNYEELIKLIQW